MEKRYKINEVAKLLGVSTSAIRFYEKKGFFQAKKDDLNGYRYYENIDIQKIWSIIYHRNIEMSLDAINDLKHTDSLVKKREMIHQQKDAIEARIEEEKRNLKIWDFYEQLVEQVIKDKDVLSEKITEPFHLFHRSFVNDTHSSIYPICHAVTVFSDSSEDLPATAVFTIIHDKYICLLTDEDKIKENETVPPFRCLYTIIQDNSDFDDAHVLKRALKMAMDNGYEVRPPHYVHYLLSSGGWDNNQRYYAVYMHKKQGGFLWKF